MLKNLPAYLAWTKKAIVNLLGLLTSLLSLGLLPDPWSGYVASAIAVLTIVVHFSVANAPAPGTALADESETDEYSENQPAEWQPAEVVTASHAKLVLEKQLNDPPSPQASA